VARDSCREHAICLKCTTTGWHCSPCSSPVPHTHPLMLPRSILPAPPCPLQVKSTYPVKLYATNVVVLVPVPDQTARATFNLTAGGQLGGG